MALDGFAPPAEEARATASHGLVQRLLAAAQALERRFDESFAAIGLNLTRAEVLALSRAMAVKGVPRRTSRRRCGCRNRTSAP